MGEETPQTRRNVPFLALTVLGLAVVFLLGLMFIRNESKADTSQEVPDLVLNNLQGKEVDLKDFRGQVVLLNNFATWCPPCRAEMPELESFYQKNQNQGFIIVAVEAGESREEVQEFTDSMKITFPVLLDPEMKSLRAFRINALPNSILIDRNGKIRQTWTGGINSAILEGMVAPIIKE